MTIEQTLSILKPDVIKANKGGAVLADIEAAGLRVVAQKRITLSKVQAEAFYAEHAARPFYNALTDFISSGAVVVSVLEGANAVSAYRTLMGATNPKDAAQGTLRQKYATSIDENAVHGSDSTTSAAREVAFFFAAYELV